MQKTFALVQSPKNLHYVPHLQHGHIFEKPKAIEVFVEQQLNGGTPLARISVPRVTGEKITATVETQTQLVVAELHFSTDPVPRISQDKKWGRKWETQAATIRENQIVAESPPEDATIWFLTVKDERETTVSSSLVFPGR